LNIKHGIVILASALVFVFVIRAGNSAYPRPDLLIEPCQLAKRSVAKHLIVLDARARHSFEQGHIPNARWVDRNAWAAAFGRGDDAASWSQRIGALGIRRQSCVVVYDDDFSKDAALIWWVLHYWGVEDVKVLNGDWTGWTAGLYPIDRSITSPFPVRFDAQAHPGFMATKQEVLASLPNGELQILDARSDAEYRGVEALRNQRAGAIPGAKQLQWNELLDLQTRRFKPATELRQLLKQRGIALDRPTATYCQAGTRASVLVFGLKLLGATDVRNYYKGWSEWGNSQDTRLVRGLAGK
jgi:thiosulfate/3-mercaptopyruvate sulfurtransferase